MDLINFKKFNFVKGKYAYDIDEWEEAHYEELCSLFKKFRYMTLTCKICDEVNYDDFIELLFKHSNKSIYYNYDEISDEISDLNSN
jgi:hypothetical protein